MNQPSRRRGSPTLQGASFVLLAQAVWVNIAIASKMPLPVYLGGAVALLAATLVVARVALAKRRATESFAEANPDQYKLQSQIRARQSRWLLWVLGAFVWFAVALIASVGIGQSVGGGAGGTITSVGLVLCFFGVVGFIGLAIHSYSASRGL
ncbi:MAG: hypothetical protein ACYCXN_15365 [Acidimicrobiales bacterium]